MLGHSHALSGAAAGLGVGLLAHFGPGADIELMLGCAGAALIPDLDSCGSCSARSLGWLSVVPSHVIRRVSGGHRHATHSLLGIAVFGALAWVACYFRHDLAGRIGLGFLVTLIVAGGLEALRIARAHVADTAGAVAAAIVVFFGAGLALIPVIVVVGCAAHIAGDMLTRSGCPLAFPLTQIRQRFLPEPVALSTGHWPERMIVDPLLIGLVCWLAYLAVARVV